MDDKLIKTSEARAEELREEIRRHNALYYAGCPAISDSEFDALMAQLRIAEAGTTPPADSPTVTVGAPPPDASSAVVHVRPMGSLDNAFDFDTLRTFYDRISGRGVLDMNFALEPKYDGLACALTYVDGKFVSAATRGDGTTGEDVSATAGAIESIPPRLWAGGARTTVVLGEVFCPLSEFAVYNARRQEAGLEWASNPRNLAAGSLRLKDVEESAERPLAFFPYDVYAVGEDRLVVDHYTPNASAGGVMTQISLFGDEPKVEGAEGSDFDDWTVARKRAWFEAAGFGLPPDEDFGEASDLNGLLAFCKGFIARRAGLDYPVDGVVVKLASAAGRARMGERSGRPLWAIAWKMPAEIAETRLVGVGFNVGRTGIIAPFARLEPVTVGGVVISAATLHNQDFIVERDLRIGDMVELERAGDVIPKVRRALFERRDGNEGVVEFPVHCPECDERVSRPEGEAHYYCVNASCPGRVVRSLLHWSGREYMDIDGLGDALAHWLYVGGLVADVSDLYVLAERRAELVRLPRMGERSADNLLAAIDESRKRPLGRLIASLGIREIGRTAGRDLAERFGAWDALASADPDSLRETSGFGPTMALRVTEWLQVESNRQLMERLRDRGVNMAVLEADAAEANEPGAGRGALEGLAVVVTGKVPGMTRAEVDAAIRAGGGDPRSSVSRRVNLVVYGDRPGSKLAKAKEYGISVVSAAEFSDMLREAR